MKIIVSALFAGLLMGFGLSLSGMGDPKNVIGFLDLFGNWNPRLIFVMGGAVVVTFIGYHFVLKRKAPLFDLSFHLPLSQIIDAKLVIGSAMFGIGWGLSGYCPGPALISLNAPSIEIFTFVAVMAASSLMTRFLLAKNSKSDEA